jgi:hypothetical protein
MYPDIYGIRPVFYGEFTRQPNFHRAVDRIWGRDRECGRAQVAIGRVIMPTFSPALITVMRSVLDDAMTKVPAEQATTVTKAYLAEFILKAAAGGLTSYEGLI